MRTRVTLRDEGMELRGYVTVESMAELQLFAASLAPMQVIVSPAEDDYDPFREQEMRELHHFETEQIIEKVSQELSITYAESPEREAGHLAFLAKRLERIAEIVNAS